MYHKVDLRDAPATKTLLNALSNNKVNLTALQNWCHEGLDTFMLPI